MGQISLACAARFTLQSLLPVMCLDIVMQRSDDPEPPVLPPCTR